jgi:hypothetical protein
VIIGAHLVCYSSEAEADRLFLQDVLEFSAVDAGRGWLIFTLPPAEMAFHPGAEGDGGQELYLLCDELEGTMAALQAKGVTFDPPTEARWGRVTRFSLPSGVRVGLYQPLHPLAIHPQK